MLKRKRTFEPEFVDSAKERFMMTTLMNKLKDIFLFVIVAIVLTWLVLGVL